MARLPVALLLLSAFALAGCSSGDEGNEVYVRDNEFEPKALTIAAGEDVHFEVEGSNPHTVTIHMVGDPVTTLKLNETVRSGEDVHFTFAAVGTYHVWCQFHGTMTTGMAMVVTVT